MLVYAERFGWRPLVVSRDGEISRLRELYERGLLTREEFETARKLAKQEIATRVASADGGGGSAELWLAFAILAVLAVVLVGGGCLLDTARNAIFPGSGVLCWMAIIGGAFLQWFFRNFRSS